MVGARVMRGMASMLMAVIAGVAKLLGQLGCASVPSVPTSTWPGFSSSSPPPTAGRREARMSAWPYSAATSGTIVTPASRYAWSGTNDSSPAPRLDQHLDAVADQLTGDLRRQGDASLAIGGLARDTNLQSGSSLDEITTVAHAEPHRSAKRFGNPSVAERCRARPRRPICHSAAHRVEVRGNQA